MWKSLKRSVKRFFDGLERALNNLASKMGMCPQRQAQLIPIKSAKKSRRRK